ncbi:hypothetical protein ISG33_16930 [Glaciecola sp. MH2013]|uniref:hypothetical protein n=1 Tax=Glaciecola sp. MH2013 TaxID=2785524 RepID=UPI00189E25D4|nr:hypothetical protein [Glaciecola sp. MH2013]MBF7075089.1 hypothetical protein [Glaciecola sp. MH2013]
MNTLKSLMDFSLKLVLAGTLTFCIASLLHSQMTLSKLIAVGVDIPLKSRLTTVAQDFVGLLPTYGLIILFALLIAMLVTLMLLRLLQRTQANNIWVFALAGAVAMAVTLMAMQPILNVTIISGARGTWGLTAQCIAGAFGGALFGYLHRRKAVEALKLNQSKS